MIELQLLSAIESELSANDIVEMGWIKEEIACIGEYLSICTHASDDALEI